MAKFGFGDLITLAKSGWTPEEVNKTIDRLEALGANDSVEPEESNGADDSEESTDNANDNKPEESNGADDSEENEKDAEIAKLKEQLAEAQKANRQQNNSSGEQKTLDDLVDDIFKDYFD